METISLEKPCAQVTPLNLQPGLDARELMQELEVGPQTDSEFQAVQVCARRWLQSLVCLAVRLPGRACGRTNPQRSPDTELFAVFLPAEVEREIESAWQESPSLGFILHGLGARLCHAAMERLLPGIVGCLPLPQLTPDEAQTLQKLLTPWGLFASASEHEAKAFYLGRSYALLTYAAYKGGCAVCALKKDCGRGQG